MPRSHRDVIFSDMNSKPGPCPCLKFPIPSLLYRYRFLIQSFLSSLFTHNHNMSSISDYKVASVALGFSLGFGFLTVWEAMKQTRRNRSPLRSTYIYMIWGEIIANLGIGILGYLFLNGIIQPGYVSMRNCLSGRYLTVIAFPFSSSSFSSGSLRFSYSFRSSSTESVSLLSLAKQSGALNGAQHLSQH